MNPTDQVSSRRLLFLVVVFCACLHPVAAFSQAPSVPGGDSPRTSGGPGDVYVNESFEAADALAKARTFAEQQRWREAAELLQATAEGMSDRVVRTPEGYVSLQNHVNRTICHWPEEGLRAYQNLFDDKLQRELAGLGSTPDVDRAVRLFDRYFCTSGAVVLGDRIAEFAIESGDLPLADWVLRRISEDHPGIGTYRTRDQVLRQLIAAIRGSLTTLSDAEAALTLRWKGSTTTLAEATADIRRTFQVNETLNANDWPMFSGAPHRNRDTSTSVSEPGLLWRFGLESDPGSGSLEQALGESGAPRRSGMPGFPVVADELVYLQSHRDIIALRRNTGAVVWSRRASDAEVESDGYFDSRPLGGDSPAVDQGRLFASLPAVDGTFYDYESARTQHELVALDARTGDVLWRIVQKSVESQGTAGAFDSAPLVRHGRVYIVSRKRRSFGFEDSYLDAYRASDGRLLFRTHIGSASTSGLTVRGATRAVAALEGDTVYVGSNLGTVTAVNAYTGGVQWLRVYERIRPDTGGAPGWPTRESGNVSLNPLIWTEGRIFVLPADSASLLVLSATDGSIEQKVPVTSMFDIHTMLGVRGNIVCGQGTSTFCYDLAGNRAIWSAKNEDESVSGRGVWAGEHLFVPRKENLTRFRAADGTSQTVDMGALYRAGHILALPDQILISTPDELLCYVRKKDIWTDIQSRMAASPADPLPALEFAEIAVSANEIDDAIGALEEGVRRIVPSLATAPQAMRTRVFAIAMRLLATFKPDQPAAQIERVFQVAAESAYNTETNVIYRFRFADQFEKRGDARRAVRLYQQILRDQSLRDWPPTQSDAVTTRSHVIARQKVAELIGKLGPEVYAEIEAQARQWLEAARKSKEAGEFERIIASYPNSQAAIDAAVAHAELLGASGRHEESARSWQRAYHLQDDPRLRPVILRRIAEHYERAGRAELAWLWLAKSAREFPEYSFDRGGKQVTFATFRDELRASRARVEPSRPRLTLPVRPGWRVDLVGPVQMLRPVYADAPETDWANIFVANPDGIRGFRGSTGESLWKQPAPVRMNAELLTARADVAVFATPFEIFALDIQTGSRRYSIGEYPARLVDPGADWEDGTHLRAHAIYGDRVVSVREDGLATCADLRTGDVIWTTTRRPAPIGPTDLTESTLVYHVSRSDRAVIHVVSAATGDLLETLATDETRPVERLHLTLDGLIVLSTSRSLTCYDPARQERRWQTTMMNSIRGDTLLFDLDSAYFLDDSGGLKRVALDDGRVAWESPRIIERDEENIKLDREGESLFLSSRSSITAVDVANGVLLWQATTPEPPRLLQRLVSQFYVAAFHVSAQAGAEKPQVLMYDHRNASGVIPRVGGRVDLAGLEPKNMAIADDALIVQSETVLQAFTRPNQAE